MLTAIDDRVRFIADLDVTSIVRRDLSSDTKARTKSSAAQESADVIAASFISFLPDMGEQLKKDVIASTLLAQLVADKRFDRVTQENEWYAYYRSILENLGWSTESFNLVEIDDANKYGSVDRLVLQLSMQYLSGDEGKLFGKTVEALKQDENKDALALLDRWSLRNNVADFQAGVASNLEGNVLLKLAAYRYTASEPIDSALFFQFGSQNVSFFSGEQTMILNEDIYAQLRQAVLGKLGEIDESKVMEIQL